MRIVFFILTFNIIYLVYFIPSFQFIIVILFMERIIPLLYFYFYLLLYIYIECAWPSCNLIIFILINEFMYLGNVKSIAPMGWAYATLNSSSIGLGRKLAVPTNEEETLKPRLPHLPPSRRSCLLLLPLPEAPAVTHLTSHVCDSPWCTTNRLGAHLSKKVGCRSFLLLC